MSLMKIATFLENLGKQQPQDSSAFLNYSNQVWAGTGIAGEFPAVFGLLDRALQSSEFLDLSDGARTHLIATLEEVRSEFEVSKLLTPAPTIWQSRSIIYPLWARLIRQAVDSENLTSTQVDRLQDIETTVQKLKFVCDNSDTLEPDAKAAIREIADLLNSAISSIHANGLADFNLDRPFLFGKVRLILTKSDLELGELKSDLKSAIEKLWNFTCTANTAADIYDKLVSMTN
jgi:hypothetical protein